MNKNIDNKGATIRVKVGENDVDKDDEHLSFGKKFAKKIFKDYSINKAKGKLKFD